MWQGKAVCVVFLCVVNKNVVGIKDTCAGDEDRCVRTCVSAGTGK